VKRANVAAHAEERAKNGVASLRAESGSAVERISHDVPHHDLHHGPTSSDDPRSHENGDDRLSKNARACTQRQ